MSGRMQTQVKAPSTATFPSARNGLLQDRSSSQTEPPTHAFGDPGLGHNFSRINVYPAVPGVIQAKLTVNRPGDKYEQEADTVAKQVVQIPENQISPGGGFPGRTQDISVQRLSPGSEELHRQTEEEGEREEEESLQAKELPGHLPEVTTHVQTHINSIKGSGQPLPQDTRKFMQQRFGYDFGQVRVHTDNRAAETAQELKARAFTLGHDIIFGSGAYAPETTTGKKLLAHELTHVVQQTSGISTLGGIQRQAAIPQQPEEIEQMLVEETVRLAKRPATLLPPEEVRRILEARTVKRALLMDFNLAVSHLTASGRAGDDKGHQLIRSEAQKLIRAVEREFIRDPKASTLDLLPGGKGQQYRDLPWGKYDFPGNKPPGEAQEDEESKRLRLQHQAMAREMTGELSKVRPERRVNIGKAAVMTKGEFDWEYVQGELAPIPGQEGHQLNRFAKDSFVQMRADALKDGVRLIVRSSDRTPSRAKLNAQKSGNPTAVAKFSAHTLGLAVDLRMSQDSQRYEETHTRPMQNVVSMHESPVHKWLFLHGAAYGWYPYQNEPWHWEYNPPGFRPRFLENMRKSRASQGSNISPPTTLQRSAKGTASPNAPSIVYDVLNSSGQPLDSATRTIMESRFGHDFSQVQVHTDARAAESARAVNARAYTVGRDMVFGEGQYAPGTAAGQRLLAHELTHTIQQRQGLVPLTQNVVRSSNVVSQRNDPLEQEAETVASQVVAGQSGSPRIISSAVQPQLQRASLWEDIKSSASAVGGAVTSAGRAVGHFVSSTVKTVAGGIASVGQNVASTLAGAAQAIEKEFKSLAELLGIPKPTEGDPSTLDTIIQVLQSPLIRGLPGFVLPASILEKLEQARSFLVGAWHIMQNPDVVIKGLQLSIAAMIGQVSGQAIAIARKSVAVPEYFEGVWRHLEPKLDYLSKNWWQVIKDTAWTLLWPWPSVWASLKDIWQHVKSGASNLWDLKFGKALDDLLAIWRGANDVAGSLYGWFLIGSVLVGAIIGAFFGGVGALPGAAVGLELALAVGEGLLISLVAAETVSILKASFDLFAGGQTEEEEEQDYEQVASSSLTLAITGVMFLIGEIAYRLAKELMGFVRVLFRREPIPRINAQKLAGHVRGTPQYNNRIKFNKPTSVFDGNMAEAERLAQTAWAKGKSVKGRPGVRDYDFGQRIGTNPQGEPQTRVRVHKDAQGVIHGHPVGVPSPKSGGIVGGILGGVASDEIEGDNE